MLLVLPRELSWAVVLGGDVRGAGVDVLLLPPPFRCCCWIPWSGRGCLACRCPFACWSPPPFGTLNGFLSRLHLALPMAVCALVMGLALFLLNRLRGCLAEGRMSAD